ncbi:ribosomal protein L32 family protein [Clostridium sporogenes]|nr:ribosomal protein L32 family protein [Clostridium sporogenes]
MLLKNEAIDVTEVIENNIIIELPIKRLCKKNCKGLCQQCGANLNFSKCKCEKDIDPRLAKLKDFFSAQ